MKTAVRFSLKTFELTTFPQSGSRRRLWRLKGKHKHGNDIYRVQLPNITPHVCRHTYCSNMARAGMNPKTLQYLMGHSDISVTLNTYTHLGLEDAENELRRLDQLEEARKEQARFEEEPQITKNQLRAI